MKALIQRVKKAKVEINGSIKGEIGRGILILLGVGENDTEKEADFLAAKCRDLRIFEDNEGKMNLSVKDINGNMLIVSQFTLYGDCTKGRRPNFTKAAKPDKGKRLYEYFVNVLKKDFPNIQTGEFGAYMQVDLINDGPVTFMLEKENK